MTISGAFNPDGSEVTSRHTLSMEESLGAIKSPQLQALKDLHAATCAESQVCNPQRQHVPPLFRAGSPHAPHVRGGVYSLATR